MKMRVTNVNELEYAFDIEKEQLQIQDQNWKSPWIELINIDLYVKVWNNFQWSFNNEP